MNTSINHTAGHFELWFTDEQPRSLTVKSLQCFSLVLLFILTFFGNSSVAWVLYKNFNIKNVPNMLLFCLTTVNISIATFSMPFAIVSTATDEWLFGETWCELSAFLNQFLTFTSNTMATVVALYRYQAIAKTFSAQITLRGAKWMTAFAVFYSFVLALPPIFGWNSYQFSRKKGFCTLHWQDGGPGMIYTTLVVLACFLIPLTMIVFMYVRIVVITRHNAENLRAEPSSFSNLRTLRSAAMTSQGDVSDDVSSDVTTRDKGNRLQRLSKRYLSSSRDSFTESKTISSVSYVMFTYCLFLAPYYVMNIASAFSQGPLSPVVDFVTSWLYYGHAAMVAVVYGYLNRRIRPVLQRLPWWPNQGCCIEQDQVFAAST